ncbi:hypothetical protein E3O62_02575 [Cryobacterium sp. TMT2-15-1]|uniref:hypothetical protein n=1 Tax=Cryobacterium sp. TMT2-15-1 TaxID=1259246 RepID=UPI0010690DCF|nr:hypothetical protein [Cryobacterium sp. TMT2-15-1]TFC63730.1 hypothetical protein E3O62_02575 [Cryobacterium sp. TMT2-15-1]
MSEYLPVPDQEPADVTKLSEDQLLDITADIETALTPLGEQAFEEYMRRQGKKINQAIEGSL